MAGPQHNHWGVEMSDVGTRRVLSVSIALLMGSSIGFLGDAHAQQDGASAGVIEEVTVTGSRLDRTGMSTPTPVTTLGVDEMEALAPGMLIEAVDQLPQFFNNTRPDPAASGRYSSGSEGQSFLNMRGMGANRTLVLLDGRRVVPTSKLGSNDINLFPEALIRRMEVVTGGASAAYGSDAVTGVTNFILDTNFDGFDARVQGGVTDRGDRPMERASVTFGTDIGRRAHIIASFEHYESESVFGYDKRDWFQDWALIQNPDANGPDRITVPHVRTTDFTYGGLITSGPLAGIQFLEDGTPAPFRAGEIIGTSSQSGGDGVNPRRNVELSPGIERQNAFLYADVELTDRTKVFGQAIFARSQIDYLVARMAAFRPFGEAQIFSDNAFLPESIREAMLAQGIDSFQMGRRSSLGDWQDINGSRNRTTSLTAGVEHEFGNGWRLNGYYQYGRNNRLNNSYMARIDRIHRAMDAVVHPETGAIVCRSTLTYPDDGCMPANFFGVGQMSEESKDYMRDWRIGRHRIEQHVAEVAVDGEIHRGWGAGPILAAAGLSYREDTLDAGFGPEHSHASIRPDYEEGYKGLPLRWHNNNDIYLANEMLEAQGGYSVREVFAEAGIPLLASRRLVELLDLNVATRYADYSGSGGVLAWKTGLDWQINQAVRLRFTRSRDTRAANLGERYDWQRVSGGIDDPWMGTTGLPPRDGTIEGGNPNVDPELSDTITFGIVYQPLRVSNLSLSLDHYAVDIKDAIAQLGNQNIIDQCFNEGSFCNQLVQDPVTGQILRVDNLFINLEQASVRGIDLETRYRLQAGSRHSFDFRFLTSYLQENSMSTPLGTKIERAGEGTFPEWTGTAVVSYANGPFTTSLTARYIGSAQLDLDWVEGVDVDRNRIDAATYLNLRFGYDLETGANRIRLFVNVENLLDRNPPIAPTLMSGWTGAAHTNGNFDQLGRRYTVGARFSF